MFNTGELLSFYFLSRKSLSSCTNTTAHQTDKFFLYLKIAAKQLINNP